MGYDLSQDLDERVYSHARAFSQHPDFKLLAAVDPDAERRILFTKTYKVPAYENLDMALAEHQSDVVVVAASTQFHSEILYMALNKGCPKAVLCEKPLSYDIDEARQMIQCCYEKGVELYVNYMRRSDPGVIEVKRLIEEGILKTPIKGVAWYSKGFIHNGSHFFNLLEYWLGSVKESHVLECGRLWDDVDPEPDVRVKFEKGCVVFLAAWEEAFSHYTVELVSSSGRVRYEQEGALIQWQPVQDDPVFKGYSILAPQAEIIPNGMACFQYNVTDQLARALRGEQAHICSGAEALHTLENMNRIIE